MTADCHRDALRDASPYHVADRLASEIVKNLSLYLGSLARCVPRLRDVSNRFAFAVEHVALEEITI